MPQYRGSSLVATTPAGPGLAMLLERVGPESARGLGSGSADDAVPDAGLRLELAIGWQKVVAWAEARLNDQIVELAGAAVSPDDEDWAREEVAAALRLSSPTAHERIEVARALTTRLVPTGRMLRKGQLTLRHATEIVNALEPLKDPEILATAEQRLLDKAASKTPAQIARLAKKEVIRADPKGADERHRRARAQRHVTFGPMPDGMAELRAFLPADGAARLRAAIDQLAGRTRSKGDPRDIDQRRADALVALAERRASGSVEGASPAADVRPRRREAAPPRVGLIAPLATVLGAAEHPGELVGYGAVPPTVTRELASCGQWEKWITDQAGVVTDLGRSTYRPPARLAALIRANYPTCVFPGCGQPSYRCDLDHVQRWTDGGRTAEDNLVPLCRRHHRAKDEAGWQLDVGNDGACAWLSPAGREYLVERPAQFTGLDDADLDAAYVPEIDPVTGVAREPGGAETPAPF